MGFDDYLRKQYQELGIKLFWPSKLIEEGYLGPETYKVLLQKLENCGYIKQLAGFYCYEGHHCWQSSKDECEELVKTSGGSFECLSCGNYFELGIEDIKYHCEITQKLIDSWNESDDFWDDYNIRDYEHLSGKKFIRKTYLKNFS